METAIPPGQQQAVVARFASPGIDSLLLVTLQSLEPGVTLEQKTQATQTAASKFPGYQSLTPQLVMSTLAGQPALQFEGLLSQDRTEYHVLLVNTIHGTDFYTLTIQIPAEAYDGNVAQAKTFVDSFAFLASSG